MADRHHNSHMAARRKPLSEVKNRINSPPVQGQDVKSGKISAFSPLHLPHNESLEPNGSLAVRDSNPSSPEHHRVSQITSEHEPNSKRDSAISSTSTNASGRRRKTYIGHWQLGKTIGKGGCSRVRVVRHKTRHQYGAVKIITRTTAESTRAQSLANLIESTKGTSASTASGHKPIPYGLEREIAVMKLLEHPNIVRLYDVWENRNELYLIMEYVDGGELFHYVDDRKGLPEDETVYIFRQIVSALLYCHRLLICHRDLKPENILLNQKDLVVKLIDFGMAALQPAGRLLSTPCGSPHYAAPEVVSSRPYDGTQADVWSCGVILYVMLTGTTPYNYSPDGDIRHLFRDIAVANYWMPPHLSPEAKDLIRRIFVPDPHRRITMDDIWDHQLLHKYDKQFALDGQEVTKEAAIGPIPTLTDFKVKRIQDIDREILRNMRTLWHSEPEYSLIQKLINDDINQEKLFYAALLKHRAENMENYTGPDDMSYSNSDYHHNQGYQPSKAPPMPTQAQRTQSQYSIMNDEHLRPSHSFVEPPPSVSSYDPYRASKSPMVNARGEYVNITVHRNGSDTNRRLSVQRSLRHPHSLRIETLKQGTRRVSHRSSSSLARSACSKDSTKRSPTSKHSMMSPTMPSSPPVFVKMRPSQVHKRGVSFGHLRRTSTTSALASQTSSRTPPALSIPDTFRKKRGPRATADRTHSLSPTMYADQTIRSRKGCAPPPVTPQIRVRKAETPSQHIRNDIRKHSAELEKACEEAFFRSSAGSTLTDRTTFSEKNGLFETPPSSVSAHAGVPTKAGEYEQPPKSRPLPEPPKETPNSYLTKTLVETREKLAAYKSSGQNNTAKFEEVMRLLENIVPTSQTSPEKRAISVPGPKMPDHLGFLPIVSEEHQPANYDGSYGNWQRSVTAPVQKERLIEDRTVRIVPPSPTGGIAPLNVRKRSNASNEDRSESYNRSNPQNSNERRGPRQHIQNAVSLAMIEEDSTLPTSPTGPAAHVRKKKSGWFGLNKKSTEPQNGSTGARTPHSLEQNSAQERRPSRVLTKTPPEKPLPDAPPPSAQSSELPHRKYRFDAGKKGFIRWLGKMGGEKDERDSPIGLLPQVDTSLDSLFSTASPAPSSDDSPPAGGPERSWFARFFNMKPATKILCFSVPRGRARQELVLLFKEWQRHGIRDLQYSRETNTITVTVDKQNALDIKPVSIRIELFVVLEHGRKVGLSIARFTQVKGAASGFKRVLEVVDGVMRGRGWLVEDEEKWKALCDVVRT